MGEPSTNIELTFYTLCVFLCSCFATLACLLVRGLFVGGRYLDLIRSHHRRNAVDSEAEAIDSVARTKLLIAEREQATKTVLWNVQSQLECPGCKSNFEEPRVLACSHTYCKHCLERAVKKAKIGKKGGSIGCPECGVLTEVPEGDTTQLAYNFSVQHAMDLVKYYSSPEPVPVIQCGNCRRYGDKELGSAVARCSSCSTFLCKQCFHLHNMDDFTKLHTTLSLTDRRSNDSFFGCLTPDDTGIRNCQKHNWKPYTHFCITCSKGVCDRCLRQEHRSHTYSRPERIRPDYEEYTDLLKSRTVRLIRKTEHAIQTTQDLSSGIQVLAATQIEEVVRTQEALSSALETRKRQLLQTLEKYQRERETRGPAENEDGTSG